MDIGNSSSVRFIKANCSHTPKQLKENTISEITPTPCFIERFQLPSENITRLCWLTDKEPKNSVFQK